MNSNGINGRANGSTAGSYMYSSSGLLGRARAVPPPTLPRHTGSFNAGSGLSSLSNGNGVRDRTDAAGGSCRLASLERLALKQRLMESPDNSLQTKRELFFKSDPASSVPAPVSAAPAPPVSLPPATAPPAPPASASVPAQPRRPAVEAHENGLPPPPPVPAAPAPVKVEVALRSTESFNKSDHHPPIAPKPDPPPKIERPKPKELDGYVGFANLPNQVYRKAVKKGFDFTLMVVGESGLGKSTLINSMFLSDIYNNEHHPGPSLRVKKTVGVETSKVLLKENGVNLTLTIVDTPGFGDAVDNSNCWVPVIDFVESKYEEFLNAESRVSRKTLADNRVHCCLYFIAPNGHGLKPLDVEFMQRLCDKVNIIPVIAKADTMTPEECAMFKKQIMNEISQHKIKIYEFPSGTDEEEEVGGGGANKGTSQKLPSRVPFAVVGSNMVIEHEGKKMRGRKYPWGVAEVENLEHCDFLALRNMVIRTHLQDLRDVTSNVHYENYRCRKLAGLGTDGKPQRISNKNPLAQMEEEKREHDNKMKKMESEMEQVFEMKVREKRQKLKDSEAELTRRHSATRRSLEQQARELEERRKAFEQEVAAWEREAGVSLDDLRRRSLEANSKETMDGKEKKDKKKKGLF